MKALGISTVQTLWRLEVLMTEVMNIDSMEAVGLEVSSLPIQLRRTLFHLHSCGTSHLVPLLKHVADHLHHLAMLGLCQIIVVDQYKAGSFVLLLHFFES